MTSTLASRIERLKELDAKRTQGEWKRCGITLPGIEVITRDVWPCRLICYCSMSHNDELAATTVHNYDFIAEAPSMMAIINELEHRLEYVELNTNRDNQLVKDACDLAKPFTPSDKS